MKAKHFILFCLLALFACKKKENAIRIEVNCDGANGYECFIREGVKNSKGDVTIHHEENFTGEIDIEYTANNEDYVFLTVYHSNDTDITYSVKYFINDALVFDCEKDEKYKDNSNWRLTSCSYEEILNY